MRQGEKAAFVVFYKELAVATDPETSDAETATRLLARATPVFAAEQVDGYQAPGSDAPPITVIPPIEQAEAFVAATGAAIHHGGSRALYPNNIAALRAALESAGVEFIAENGGGPGVRLKKARVGIERAAAIPVEELTSENDD